LINALRIEGVTVQTVDSAATLKQVLDASGLSLAYEMLAFAGIVSTLLALGAAVFNILITAQRRAQEISVLEAMGIRGSTLGRSLFAEHMLVLGAGAMVGVAAGSVSAAITLPAIPELSGDVLQPLQYALPAVPILGVAAVLLVALALVTGSCAVWTMRLAVPARLRMALM
jgi:ABC-type antimicrobial peptide transport system permease subunit